MFVSQPTVNLCLVIGNSYLDYLEKDQHGNRWQEFVTRLKCNWALALESYIGLFIGQTQQVNECRTIANDQDIELHDRVHLEVLLYYSGKKPIRYGIETALLLTWINNIQYARHWSIHTK